MTPAQALANLEQVALVFVGTRQQHEAVAQSIEVLRALVTQQEPKE